jgi:hypothetical protein
MFIVNSVLIGNLYYRHCLILIIIDHHQVMEYSCGEDQLILVLKSFIIGLASDFTCIGVTIVNGKRYNAFLDFLGNFNWWAVDTISWNSSEFSLAQELSVSGTAARL